jgi:hypothetical protein
VEIVTVSPLSTVTSGFSAASKNPQCTVSGAASTRWFAIPFLQNPARLLGEHDLFRKPVSSFRDQLYHF